MNQPNKPMIHRLTTGDDADGKLVYWKEEKWIKTNEDWYPSFRPLQKSDPWSTFRWNNPLNNKAVYVMMTLLTDGTWRVAVWGADDCGMEVDLPHEIKGTAQSTFDSIKDFSTKDFLKSIGLHGA